MSIFHGRPWRDAWQLVRESSDVWLAERGSSLGAALSFYALFSLAPMLSIAIWVAGMIFGAEAARGEIYGQIRGLVGEAGATAIQGLIESASRSDAKGWASAFAVVMLVAGATSVFVELKASLDRIWNVSREQVPGGVLALMRGRFLSFGLVLAIGFLLLVSLVASAALSALGDYWGGWWKKEIVFWNWLQSGITVGIIGMLFACIYKWLPERHLRWRDIWLGAAVTAVLFGVGRTLIGLYLGHSTVATGFGAAASLIVVLLWIYYSAQIFFFGAAFTKVYAQRYGSLKDEAPERSAQQGRLPPRGNPRDGIRAAQPRA